MARRCENCIHDKVCNMWAVDSGIPFVNADTCEHYKPAADVAPKIEVVREFAEEVKLEFYREFDEIIPSIMADKIDDLVKKYTEDEK